MNAEREKAKNEAGDLERFYERVDGKVRRIHALDPERFHCRSGCHDCCIDRLSVFEIEAENITRYHRNLLLHGKPHPQGECAFLDDSGLCRIYEHRPYVCRTQGLPLRWMEELPDGSTVEMRDICPINERGRPVETLEPEACWSIGPFEEELARMQIARDKGKEGRVLLRELFMTKK